MEKLLITLLVIFSMSLELAIYTKEAKNEAMSTSRESRSR
jgi:hypothetical protein